MKNATVEQINTRHEYATYWQEVLNLGDWRIEFVNKPAKGCLACVSFDSEQRLAGYRLGNFENINVTNEFLKELALHEVLHVFLYDFRQAKDDDMAEHKVINMLEKLLMRL